MSVIEPERILQAFLEQFLWKYPILWRLPLVCILMLATAAAIWISVGSRAKSSKITALYWLTCGLGLWLTIYLPWAVSGRAGMISSPGASLTDEASDYVYWILPGSATMISAVSLLFAAVPIWAHNRRRKQSWPDRLDDLLADYRPPAGMITSMTALSLLVFFLALCHITSIYSVFCGLMMGVALLLLVGYVFRPEAALAGVVLLSLSVVCAFLVVSVAGPRPVPTIVNLVVMALACLAFFWIWLGRVWRQQILPDGPLTTAARMVPLTVHAGVMMLGFGSLLLLKLSVWPRLRVVGALDNGLPRFALLAVAGLLLLLANFWIAAKLRSKLLGLLLIFNLGALTIGYLVRMPVFLYHVVRPYWPVWAVAASIGCLILAGIFRMRDHRCLAEPAAMSAMIFAPTVLLWSSSRQPSGFKLLALALALIVAFAAWKMRPADNELRVTSDK